MFNDLGNINFNNDEDLMSFVEKMANKHKEKK